MFGIILAVVVFAQHTAQDGLLQQIIQPAQKAVAEVVPTQNTLDADHGAVIAWAEFGKLGQAVKAALKVTQQAVFQ